MKIRDFLNTWGFLTKRYPLGPKKGRRGDGLTEDEKSKFGRRWSGTQDDISKVKLNISVMVKVQKLPMIGKSIRHALFLREILMKIGDGFDALIEVDQFEFLVRRMQVIAVEPESHKHDLDA